MEKTHLYLIGFHHYYYLLLVLFDLSWVYRVRWFDFISFDSFGGGEDYKLQGLCSDFCGASSGIDSSLERSDNILIAMKDTSENGFDHHVDDSGRITGPHRIVMALHVLSRTRILPLQHQT